MTLGKKNLGALLQAKIGVCETYVSRNLQQFTQAICVFIAIRSNLHRLFISSYVFIANHCKLPQIVTYAGFADPNFHLQTTRPIFFFLILDTFKL